MPEETTTTQPTSIKDLRPKMKLEGTVTRTELYGAFVDLGLEREGMIHISRMARRRVNKVSDKLKVGDKVTVWVVNVDQENGRIGLTMVEPPEVDWDELAVGQIRKGKVVRMERYGAFVDIGAERPGLLHVKEMGRYVRNPNEVVKDGEEIEVRIIGLNPKKHQIDLSLDMGDSEPMEADEEEPMLSPMELAFRRAQSQHAKKKSRGGKRKRRQYEEWEEIYRRTLDRA